MKVSKSKPILSIITPVFNGIHYIDDCIKNVILQQCPFLEHIIIDGGSTDGTMDVIKRFAEKHDHIRWVSEKDKGQSDAINKGTDMAEGDIIGILNADDFYEPNVLNKIIKYFNSIVSPAIIVGKCNVLNDHDQLLFVSAPSQIGLNRLLKKNICNLFQTIHLNIFTITLCINLLEGTIFMSITQWI